MTTTSDFVVTAPDKTLQAKKPVATPLKVPMK